MLLLLVQHQVLQIKKIKLQRDDDREETVKKRLDVYSQQTRPLVDYYGSWAKTDPAAAPKYRAISGLGTVEEITARALAAIAQ